MTSAVSHRSHTSASPQDGRGLHEGARISRETSAAAVIPETGHRAPHAALPHGAVRMALSSSRTCGKCEHFLSLSHVLTFKAKLNTVLQRAKGTLLGTRRRSSLLAGDGFMEKTGFETTVGFLQSGKGG